MQQLECILILQALVPDDLFICLGWGKTLFSDCVKALGCRPGAAMGKDHDLLKAARNNDFPRLIVSASVATLLHRSLTNCHTRKCSAANHPSRGLQGSKEH